MLAQSQTVTRVLVSEQRRGGVSRPVLQNLKEAYQRRLESEFLVALGGSDVLSSSNATQAKPRLSLPRAAPAPADPGGNQGELSFEALWFHGVASAVLTLFLGEGRGPPISLLFHLPY